MNIPLLAPEVEGTWDDFQKKSPVHPNCRIVAVPPLLVCAPKSAYTAWMRLWDFIHTPEALRATAGQRN